MLDRGRRLSRIQAAALPRIQRVGGAEVIGMPTFPPQVLVLAGACLFAGFGAAVIAESEKTDEPIASAATPIAQTDAADATREDAPSVVRVGGDLERTVEWRDDTWHFSEEGRGPMTIEAPLPEGYPAPTPPGAIEIKTYPSVRRAEFTGRGNEEFGMNLGFWPLFQHIQRRDIAMTSPVEMDYTGWSPDQETPTGEWTMSFLYRTADLGPTGEDGRVKIVDTAPVTVIAMGVRGPYGSRTVAPALESLMDWLANQPADAPQWEIAGDPRAFYYNGPSVRNANKWAEAQIPVRLRSAG